jgi:hypothetical protein
VLELGVQEGGGGGEVRAVLELGVQGGGREGGKVWAVLELGVQEGRVGEVRGSARAGCTGRRRWG